MYIVPADGADRRFLGGSARARNARVALRVGARRAALEDLRQDDSESAVLVPAESALMLPLFSDPMFVNAVRGGVPTWLEAEDGGSILVGPAHAVPALADNAALCAAVPRLQVARGTILKIATAADRRRATRVALRATQKSTDGWISRHVNRPVSRACSRVALSMGMTATGASFVTLLFGLLTAVVAAQPGDAAFVATGVLFQIASVLDGVDGEIARATLTESDAGARVDTVVDQATYLTCLIGLTVGWVREGHGRLALGSMLVVGAALLFTLRWAGRFVARHADTASFVFIDRAVRRAAHDTGHLPLRMAASVFTLLRRDLFAVIFLIVSLTGQRVMVPALVLAGVAIANVTFLIYGRQLAEAARAERA